MVLEPEMHREPISERKITTNQKTRPKPKPKTQSVKRQSNANNSLQKRKMKSDDKSEQDFVLDPTSQKLYEALRDWRTEVYTKINKPAYIVMANKVIKQIAYHKPTSKDELLTIRGIGQAKLHQYGDEIIAIVSTFLDN